MMNRLKSLYDNARTQTFSHNGAKITVRESLGIDQMDMSVYRRFVRVELLAEQEANDPKNTSLHDIDWNRIVNFVLFASRTVSIKGKLGAEFKLPAPSDDEAAWYKAYWQFLTLPGDLIETWDDALVAVNKIEPDPEVLPGDESSTTNT